MASARGILGEPWFFARGVVRNGAFVPYSQLESRDAAAGAGGSSRGGRTFVAVDF